MTFLLLMAVLAVPVSAEGLAEFPDLPKNVCVVDDADMLSNETEQWLDSLNGTLQQGCEGATIAVLTVQDIGVLSAADYATQAFNEWGVGDKDENNGVLVLLSRTSSRYADGDYYVALGAGLDGTQLSSELKTILNKKMEKPFSKGDYDKAIKETVKTIEVSVRDQYGQGTFGHKVWMKIKAIAMTAFEVFLYLVAAAFIGVHIYGIIAAVKECFSRTFGRGKKKGGKYSSYGRHHSRSSSYRRRSSSGSRRMDGGRSFGGGAGRG